jgi:hypothetical protein
MLAIGPRIQQKSQSLLPLMQELGINFENHGWSRFLTQQTSITFYRLPAKENKLPFYVYRLQKADRSLPFPFFIPANKWKLPCSIYEYIYIYMYRYLYTYILPFQTVNEKQKAMLFSLIHLPFAHCANGNYPFANGLCGLNGLAHLC